MNERSDVKRENKKTKAGTLGTPKNDVNMQTCAEVGYKEKMGSWSRQGSLGRFPWASELDQGGVVHFCSSIAFLVFDWYFKRCLVRRSL